MPNPNQTIDLPMQHIEARVLRAEARDGAEAPRNRFKVVFTTGAKVRRYDWRSGKSYDEELETGGNAVRLSRLNAGASVLNAHSSHDLDDVIGAVVPGTARMRNGEGECEVIIDDGPETAAILRKIEAGIIRHVSMGYIPHEYEKTVRDDGPDQWRATDWEPYEISFVPIPADPGAGRRADERSAYPCRIINLPSTKERAMPQATETANTPEAQPAEGAPTPTRAAPAETPPAAVSSPAPADPADAVKAERHRAAEIVKIGRAAGMAQADVDKLIADGATVDKARERALTLLAEKSDRPGEIRSHVMLGDQEHDKFVRGATDWIVAKAGQQKLVEDHTKAKVEPGESRGLSLFDLARDCAERAGVKTRGMNKMDVAGAAFNLRAAGYQGTSDFPVILETAMHKILLAAYATAPDTWRRFCAVGSVSDFRVHNRYRLGSFGKLDKVNENGEFKNKPIGDATKQGIKAETFGNIIALTRQAIINDDMGAFDRLASQLGRAAKLSIEADVYALLALNSGLGPTMPDGNTLFHASRGNIGTGSALGVAGLDADRVLMASQKDQSGNDYLDIRPSVLAVPIGLGGAAKILNGAQYDPDVTSKFQVPNKVAGLFNDVVDTPRLTGTRRYLFADPSVAPVIEVAFLDGQQEPYLETKEGFRVDGTEWKIRLDYGVGAIDTVGALTNAGA
ncbi:prohead protease/major capsid protein fusion protein [Paludisphaera rhizosphaerae]|uniref:prohead protease/major capsid protein fusion protein n=1 Tax=Paludisphaera rhizosphaerae TaxID=2711216 RepID=UPI0013ED79AD|nr:prohead protease/major capsid protein fusion protein [Paludisphaera rhizosphaerae]